jgi:hypothetical protein
MRDIESAKLGDQSGAEDWIILWRYERKDIGGVDSDAQEAWRSGIERDSTGAEWRIGGAEKVEVEATLTQVGHADVVSRRKTGAD